MAEATEAYHGHAREEAVAAFAKSWCGYKRWSNWMLRPSVQPSCCRAARNDSDAPHPLALLRARRERPCGRRAAEKRDEFASMWLIEWHPTPMSRDPTAEYRIHEGQSGGIWQGHDGAGPLPRSGSVIWLGTWPPG